MKPVIAYSVALTASISLWAVVVLGEAITAQRMAGVVGSATDPDSIDLATAQSLDHMLQALTRLELAATVLVGVAMVAWLFRVRANAVIAGGHQRWGRPWIVLGWIVPIVNLWIPKQMVEDVWVAGRPQRGIAGKSLLVSAWWISWLLYCLVSRFVGAAADSWGGLHAVHDYATNTVMACGLGIPPVVLALVVVWKIDGFQHVEEERLELVAAGRA
ncbi:DUF4328 domain-containing protein [Actinomadura barringtoniae]|uniref:DUF4328 domain-containing protein n=1 Tax=Actinomadura barringtoniae TaxID=1427535 RepID=A0A939TE57_9ACTN|nr:DUF4328 domain-containing protein [Actinomadura barringtoniae]MBO2452995.1 DUF4328 domain-containing protein [Actinomadura barringtoniae]